MVKKYMTFDIGSILGQAIAYLLFVSGLAGAIQVAINQLKPQFLEPLKERLTESTYLGTMYAFRFVLTLIGYFAVWGGSEATRSLLPSLPSGVPDAGLAFVTILLIVLGQEVIHALMDKLYAFKDAVYSLSITDGALIITSEETEDTKSIG